ncbi:hypothetical protein DB32_007368 [Sandaracinus amylolyticus]|uniref:Uncharacterized protein n=1 Tax=Sandaracinus amylolyticus TaxID=927083 RepID=A0A0F6SHC8_9BACT|nr:hypothetical protein DB32_007368 [Sandaracinus amylolyticus]
MFDVESTPDLDLAAGEPVFKAAPVRIAASPGAFGGLEGSAVLTSQRLIVVPGAMGEVRRGDPLQRALATLWERVKPAVLDAFPIARLLSRARDRNAQLAARARPGIEIPLETVRRAFEARLPGWIGLELALPLPDPRPPFALYLQLDVGPGPHREWAQQIEALRTSAPARPELERPYALFYLLQPPPRPMVRVRSAEGTRKGALVLHADGPAIATTFASERVLLPYESITRIVYAAPTSWRRSFLRIEAGEHVMRVEPQKDWDAQRLHDSAHLLAEIAGVPLRRDMGDVRAARVMTAVMTAAGAAAAVAYEVLQSLP